ncbi:MAG TPA: GtrA family protein [Natronosporangium sp.]
MRGWYRRWRTLIGEAWRFGIVGAANVVINFVVFNALALTLFSGSELKANVAATAVATTTSYLMNRGWTFRHRKTSRISREYVLFFAFNAAGLAIELGVMGAAKYGLGLTTLWALNFAKAAGLGLGTIFRFWTYRTFVFAGKPAPAEPAIPAPQPSPEAGAVAAGAEAVAAETVRAEPVAAEALDAEAEALEAEALEAEAEALEAEAGALAEAEPAATDAFASVRR